jgi:hypothetical protein
MTLIAQLMPADEGGVVMFNFETGTATLEAKPPKRCRGA